MNAADVMTSPVATVSPGDTVMHAVRLMLQDKISGLPVVADDGRVIGIVTEGDLLRRAELGTARHRPRWLELLMGPGRLAGEYVHASGRRISEIMTDDIVTASEDTPLETIVALMEKRRIKRLPILRDGKLVGIVSRANLVHALAGLLPAAAPTQTDDAAIRERLLAELRRQAWGPTASSNVVVRDGVVDLFGAVTDDRTAQAMVVAAENVPGVKSVRDHIAVIEPATNTVIPGPYDRAAGA